MGVGYNTSGVREVMVSVVMITYGHENYIADAIEGILMQVTDFSFELIIANDNSPDNTDEIIKNIIATHRNGHLINYTNHEVNLGMMKNFMFAIGKSEGKYIALCEGDDQWSDPFKLQKQVSFLENNPEYSLTVGGFISKNSTTNKEIRIVKQVLPPDENNADGYTFTLEDTKKAWLTKTLTAVFVNNQEMLAQAASYRYAKDVHIFYHLLKLGKGFYFTDVFGVYNIHGGGVFSTKKEDFNNFESHYFLYKELFKSNADAYTLYMYRKALFAFIQKVWYSKNSGAGMYRKKFLIREGISVSRGVTDYMDLLAALMSPRTKRSLKNILRS